MNLAEYLGKGFAGRFVARSGIYVGGAKGAPGVAGVIDPRTMQHEIVQEDRFTGGHLQVDHVIGLGILGLIGFGDIVICIEDAEFMAARHDLHTAVGRGGVIKRGPHGDEWVAI